MKVFSLLGFVDYEGSDLVGVFSSKEKLMEYVSKMERRGDRYGYFDQLGYVEHELDVELDVLGQVEYL